MIDDAGRPTLSPGLTFFCGTSDSLRDEALLEHWSTQVTRRHKGFERHESEILILAGVPTLAVHYDFQKPFGRWRCYATIRVRGHAIWRFDASGLREDLERLRAQIVPVLASLNIRSARRDELPSERGTDANSGHFRLVCRKCGTAYTLGKDSISMTSEEAFPEVRGTPPKLMIGWATVLSTPQLIRECHDQSLRLGPSRGWSCTNRRGDNPWPQA